MPCIAQCAGAHAAAATGELSGHALEVGTRARSYLLYTPADAAAGARRRPLVLVFHGGGGNAQRIANEVGPSLHAIADREGFFVAYPDAVNKMWDFGAGEVSEALDERVDDRAYFAAMLDELIRAHPLDTRRIFATGISRGGQASYFVACAFPGRIRAIAPVAMPMPVFMRESCEGAPGTGVAILNGTGDPLVPYDGGQIKVGRHERGAVMSTAATVDFWRTRNGCAAEPTLTTVIDPVRRRHARDQNDLRALRARSGGAVPDRGRRSHLAGRPSVPAALSRRRR